MNYCSYNVLKYTLQLYYKQAQTQVELSFTFFIKSVGGVLDRFLDGGLIAVSPFHLGSSVITRGLCSTASTTLTMELHQFAHCNEEQEALKFGVIATMKIY